MRKEHHVKKMGTAEVRLLLLICSGVLSRERLVARRLRKEVAPVEDRSAGERAEERE
jgi:hypothetical protein